MFFNIFINDLLLLVLEDTCNFADDNTLYVYGDNIDSVLSRLHNDLHIVLDWVSNNDIVANPDKFQAIFQLMLIETFKSINKLNPEFMWNLFILRENYNLRRGSRRVV